MPMTRALIAAVLALAPALASADCPDDERNMLRGHREALVEALRGIDAELFLKAFIERAGDPPQRIKPRAALVFNSGAGLQVQWFDENGCASFGASIGGDLYREIRISIGVRA